MKQYKLNEIENKKILGRTLNKGDSLCLLWGASALELNVRAKEVWVNLSCSYDTNEPWVSVEVNRYETNRFAAPQQENWICVARNLNPEKINLISIIKDTQAMAGDNSHALFINGIALDDNGTFEPVKPRSKKIEFVGDSITSGEGLAGNPDEMDWISQWFRSSKTYAVQTAALLDADWSCVSQSGWGISWGWDGNFDSCVPKHYLQVCSLLNGDIHKNLGTEKPFDFGKGSDYVVINLGTNDNSGLNVPDFNGKIETVYDDVIAFVETVRNKNPGAKILWVWGMINIDKVPAVIQKAIQDYKAKTGDKNVFTLELPDMAKVEITNADKGSRGHPGPKTHLLAAEKIVEFLKNC
ncbi:MAG: SGNH/GDSL hydrolase family protein [Treponema sp.]|nr:SGNH/GDSL hydrolase family protein [Treponema sp.]